MPVAGGDAADARLVGLDELPGYSLSPGLAGFLAGIGCWPEGAPVPDDLPALAPGRPPARGAEPPARGVGPEPPARGPGAEPPDAPSR